MLGAAFGGPLGGAAATAICNKLGLKVDPTNTASLTSALTPLMGDPATLVALKEADNEFAETMAKLGYADVESLAAIDETDRSSARLREVAVKDYTPEVGFYLLLLAFSFFLYFLVKYPIPQTNSAVVFSAFGSLGTLLLTAATYFYGSTRGSQNKDDMLANSVPASALTTAVESAVAPTPVRPARATDAPKA